MLLELILHLHFTKSLKRDNIDNLCLKILEENICLITGTLACFKAEI